MAKKISHPQNQELAILSASRFYTNFPQVETEKALAYLQQQKDWLRE